MSQPEVDVLVVTWNTGAVTAQALRHLLDSDQGARLRVLVHDNASSDGTPRTLAEQVPEAQVVAGADNLGFAGGVNLLLRRATAPWLLVLNSDAWPDPSAVGRLVAVAAADPRIGLVAPRLESPAGELELSCLPAPSVRTAWAIALEAERWAPAWADRHLLPRAWGHDVGRDVDWVVGACWLLRREAVAQVGPLDDSLFMYGEDVEYGLRLGRAGWRLRYEPAAVVRHLGNASGRKAYDGDARTRAWVGNDLRLFRRGRSAAATRAYALGRAAGAWRSSRTAAGRGDADGAAHWRSVRAAYSRGTGRRP